MDLRTFVLLTVVIICATVLIHKWMVLRFEEKTGRTLPRITDNRVEKEALNLPKPRSSPPPPPPIPNARKGENR